MWTSRLTQASAGKALNVVLARDDVTFLIGLNDWWDMSATQHLADQALKESNLDFKMRELYDRPSGRQPLWTTDLVSNGDSYTVHLIGNGSCVAVFSLDEFAKLSATKFAVEDAVEVAAALAPYGRNAQEVDEYLKDELKEHDVGVDESSAPDSWESPRKR